MQNHVRQHPHEKNLGRISPTTEGGPTRFFQSLHRGERDRAVTIQAFNNTGSEAQLMVFGTFSNVPNNLESQYDIAIMTVRAEGSAAFTINTQEFFYPYYGVRLNVLYAASARFIIAVSHGQCMDGCPGESE